MDTKASWSGEYAGPGTEIRWFGKTNARTAIGGRNREGELIGSFHAEFALALADGADHDAKARKAMHNQHYNGMDGIPHQRRIRLSAKHEGDDESDLDHRDGERKYQRAEWFSPARSATISAWWTAAITLPSSTTASSSASSSGPALPTSSQIATPSAGSKIVCARNSIDGRGEPLLDPS